MKRLLLIPMCCLLLVACGDETASTSPALDEQQPPKENAVSDAAVQHELPWGIPIMPGARYISGSLKFSRTTTKRGGEAIATIAVKGSVQDIITFYESALQERGFSITSKKLYDGEVGNLHSENSKGERFNVSASRGGSKAKEGESTAALLAIKPKLTEPSN